MAQVMTLKVKGLITNPNTLEPNFVDGALAYADNIVVDKDNLAESRRGFSKYGQYIDLGGYTETISSMFSFQSNIIVHYSNKLAKEPVTSGTGEWEDYNGTFDEPDSGYKIRSLDANQNLYITTSDGIKKLGNINGEFENAGVVRSLDGFGSATGVAGGWFDAGTTVAYRMVWGKFDANKNLLLGAPSSRVVVANTTGGAANVNLTFLIPDEITTDYFYQIYRSPLTGAITDEPTDELQLVKEGKPASGDITTGEFVVLDNTPDDIKGATLYTSPSQQGIIASNEPPPFAKDFADFKNHVFFANTRTKQRLTVSLIGTSASSGGFAIGDTFTIDGLTYTGAAAEDVNDKEFIVYDSASPAADIQDTALSLIKVINKSHPDIYAYYLSGFEDVPGQMLFEKINLADGSFTAVTNKGQAFNPTLPSTGSNDDNTSDNEIKVNRVYISKPQQPEAVPLFSYLDIGSANSPIQRIIALRDGVFIFKGDGVFRISGETLANFRVSTFDNNIQLIAPESAVTFNNTIFCLTLQGVVSVSDSGVAVVSRPIEQQLLKLVQYPSFANSTFAVSYESERKYILFCVASENQDYPTQAYVYNSFTNAWSRWTVTATCGLVKKTDDKLYYGGKLAGFSSSWVYKERKTFTEDDFVDDDWGVSILSKVSNTVLQLNRVDDAVVGYWIRQFLSQTSTYVLAKIVSVDTVNNRITVSPGSADWSNDPVNPTTIYKPIVCRAKWVANTAGNPGVLKHFREATLFFRQDSTATIRVGYETNFQPGYEYTELELVNTGLWGEFNWGTFPWNGLDDTYAQPLRVGVPRNKQKCLWISFSVEGSNAFSSFSLGGISAQFEVISERFKWSP